MDLGLTGKRALVGGASGGLGAAIAATLAAEGCTVEISSRSADRAEAAAERIEADTGSRVRGYAVDAADNDAIASWITDAAGRMDGIDIVIPNSGGPPAGAFDETDADQWDAAYHLLLRSAMTYARSAKPHMPKGGTMLYLTSSSVKQPFAELSMSGIFRAGVSTLAKTLAAEWGTDGIRVNHLIPGRIDTERVKSLDAGSAERLSMTIDEVQRKNVAAIPTGRYGTPPEFAAAAAFLVSEQAAYITGATLQVDGGAISSIF